MSRPTARRTSPSRLAIALLGALSLAAAPLHAQKTDVVTLRNGDKVTGEIKRLSRGKLEYSTDDMGTTYIEWDKIAGLTSRWYFEIELQNGRRLYGNLPAAAEPGFLVVALVTSDTVALSRVIRITPIEDRFWDRVRIRVNLGFTLTKADNQQEYSLGLSQWYRGRKFESQFNYDGYFRTRDDGQTVRNSLQVAGGHKFAPKWTIAVAGNAQQNDELSLDLRAQIGPSLVRSFVQSNTIRFGGLLYLLGGIEKFASDDTVRATLELQLAADFEAFRYDDPDLDFTGVLSVIPSLSDLGRVRVNFNADLSYEVLSDFTLGIKGFFYYDSRPPTEDTANDDYAVTLTLGWKYN